MLWIVCIVVLLIASTVIHCEALRGLSYSLPRLNMPPRTKAVSVLLGAFALHVLQILLYSAACYWLAWDHGLGALGQTRQPSLLTCVHFSWTSYSSLGYGDVVPTGGVEDLRQQRRVGRAAPDRLDGRLHLQLDGTLLGKPRAATTALTTARNARRAHPRAKAGWRGRRRPENRGARR